MLTSTFVTFTPWTTWRDFLELLETLVDLDLVENVAPIQLAIRLLIPAGSRLLELPEMQERLGEFDSSAPGYEMVLYSILVRHSGRALPLPEIERQIHPLLEFRKHPAL